MMVNSLAWGSALLVGLSLTWLLTGTPPFPLVSGGEGGGWSVLTSPVVSNLAAWALVCVIWQLFGLRFVASRRDVSKMSDAVPAHLRLLVRRMLLTLLASVALFLAARPHWGVAYWLGIAAYYQVGVALTLYHNTKH